MLRGLAADERAAGLHASAAMPDTMVAIFSGTTWPVAM